MTETNPNKTALISGIEADAVDEVKKIIRDAEKQAADKRKYADQKVASLLDEAKQRAQEQADAIRRKAISRVELEIKRRSLKVRDTIMQQVMDRVEAKLLEYRSEPGYRAVLRDWIVEAAIGLDVESARLNASAAERSMIDNDMLNEVTAAILKQGGRAMTITMTDEPPLDGQGIVLTAVDGRMAFNNQVRTRIQRNRQKIQMLIHEALFNE